MNSDPENPYACTKCGAAITWRVLSTFMHDRLCIDLKGISRRLDDAQGLLKILDTKEALYQIELAESDLEYIITELKEI